MPKDDGVHNYFFGGLPEMPWKILPNKTTGYMAKVENPRSKVHAFYGNQAICGTKFAEDKEFQWCAEHWYKPYIECKHCLRILEREKE